MSLWKYNDVELEVDMNDVEFAEKYEAAFIKLDDSEKRLVQENKTGMMSGFIKGYCKLYYDLFDDLFGTGMGEKLMGKKMNVQKCEECYDSFLSTCKEQVYEINKKRAATLKKFVPKRK